ncbi:hypothetical protein K7X08_005941 [Anisodus acutangulus]|uniref:Uncharacterized protein n=1 Tax=Anisodus acutangulus TaxID=402998 RepID=A0A9Q1LTC6_9SOLA|nr:hypothetical protein K7X08_005941 [Anisodus acutangulus]
MLALGRKSLSPNGPVFVPSKYSAGKNDSRTIISPTGQQQLVSKTRDMDTLNAIDSSQKSLAIITKDIGVLAKSHEPQVVVSGLSPTTAYDIDLGDDMFDGDDEDEILDICFDKVAKDGDLSPRQQRNGSNKSKKKKRHMEHNIVGIVR